MRTALKGITHQLVCHCGSETFSISFLGARLHEPDQIMATCTRCTDHVLIDYEEEPERIDIHFDWTE